MTVKLYDGDSHLKEFEATVISCEKHGDTYASVFDKTAFFPEGGGQESDRGLAGKAKVFDVQEKNGVIYHSTDIPLKAGETVKCSLDWAFRFRNMQNHSGEHIISGIVHKLYGFNNTGFHLGTEMTLDFNGELTREQLKGIEYLANEAIYKNAAFKCYYPPRDELENLEYRSKLELTENVRIVEIEGYDVCACCAPHVKSAAEIGIIKILDAERNKGGVRLFVKCGKDALDDYNVKYENILKISSLLSTKQYETAKAAEKLAEQNSQLKFELSKLRRALIAEKVKGFNSESKCTAAFEEGLDMKELQLYADSFYKAFGGLRAAFSKNADGFNFAICSDAPLLDCFFADFKKSFSVRGGGRNGMVQGSITADRADIEAYFKNKAFN